MKTIGSTTTELSRKRRNELLAALKARFDANQDRHPGVVWAKVQARLEAKPDKLWSLAEMERTGGEPDVVAHDKKSGEFVFFDCSEQSPAGRTSLCYDREALNSRKEHKPKGSVMDLAAMMGVEVLTEAQYFELQKLGEELLTLRADLMARLDLTEKFRDAIADARRITNFEGKRRQMQFIGKLMRDIDPAPIRARLDIITGVARESTVLQHRIERWRDRWGYIRERRVCR